MSISFSDLKLEEKNDVNTILINDIEIEIKQYLPVALKSMFIESAVRGSVVEGIVDEVLMDAYLHLLIFENYTNIEFTNTERESLLKTFDLLQKNGIFEQVIAAMPDEEYNYVFNSAIKLAQNVNEYNRSMNHFIEKIIEKLDFSNLAQKINGQTS